MGILLSRVCRITVKITLLRVATVKIIVLIGTCRAPATYCDVGRMCDPQNVAYVNSRPIHGFRLGWFSNHLGIWLSLQFDVPLESPKLQHALYENINVSKEGIIISH